MGARWCLAPCAQCFLLAKLRALRTWCSSVSLAGHTVRGALLSAPWRQGLQQPGVPHGAALCIFSVSGPLGFRLWTPCALGW
eukprot:6217026-Alexandrium_andersonii.AAC.1